MSDRYGKGSIIFKLLIVILLAALGGSIYYPKTLWEEEAKNVERSRQNMESVYNANLLYQRATGEFTDSLDLLINFVRDDSAYHAFVDSALTKALAHFVQSFDSMGQEQRQFDELIDSIDPADSLQVDSLARRISNVTREARFWRDKLEVLREEMKLHPSAPLTIFDTGLEIVERKDFYHEYKRIQNMVEQGQKKEAHEANGRLVENYSKISASLMECQSLMPDIFSNAEKMTKCPTTQKEYILKVALIDSGLSIVEVIVESPIDSTDITGVDNDFLLSTIGALTIENHGKIKGGEKSWEN